MLFQKKYFLWIASFVAVSAVAAGIYYYQKNKSNGGAFAQADPAFGTYIYAYTSGVVSNSSPIKIVLAADVNDSVQSEQLIKEELFDFSPDIKGKAYWTSANTIEFRPEQPLEPGQLYEAEFELGKVIEVKERNLEVFPFNFKVIPQNFELKSTGFRYYDKRNFRSARYTGVLTTADRANNEAVEKILSAKQDGKDLKINWNHSDDKVTHEYSIEQVTCSESPGKVALTWDGSPLNVDKKGTQDIEIPALGDFKVMTAAVVNDADQYVSVFFSFPLSETQNRNGLITVSDISAIKLMVIDNELRIYPDKKQVGTRKLTIDASVKNIFESPLKEGYSEDIVFEEFKPSIEAVGQGVILPSTNGMVLPFKAINLKSVNVKIIRIYESNVTQFLQVNTLSGDNELKRVGRPIINKKLNLKSAGDVELNHWNRFAIDLSEYIKVEPGAIYQVQLSFGKPDVLCNCPENEEKAGENILNDGLAYFTDENDESQYDNPGYYYGSYDYEDYYYEDYNWNERENPCNPAFYSYGNKTRITKNILSSDLGIIAKGATNGNMTFVVADLKSTDPISGVTLEVYNFQRQLITTLKTDGDGIVQYTDKRKPFLLIAKQGVQRGYLKLDDGSSLSLSNFDISGESIQKGLKGFIYTERGVWRPGDSLFVTFILNDENNPLPESHPVVFELYNPQDQLAKRIVKANPVNNFYTFKTSTPTTAPTGNWKAKVVVGGAEFTKKIKIEAVKPNRLKINLDFGKEKLTEEDSPITAKLDVKWLHGAPVSHLKATYEVDFSKGKTAFKNFPDYSFDDPSKKLDAESQVFFNGQLNEQGQATIRAEIDLKGSAPGMVNAHFKGKVFEESGDFSVDYATIPFYPYTSFVGVSVPQNEKGGRLETDKWHNVNIAVVNAEGKLINRKEVEVTLYKMDWRWWWENSYENVAYYVSDNYKAALKKETLSLSNGKGTWKMKIDYPAWGRYLVRVTDPVSGHSSGSIVYIDWPSTYSRDKREGSNWATMLSFTTDKQKYNVGDQVHLTIPSSEGGRAFISLESGSKVVKTFWVKTTAGQTVYSFEATADLSPNVYAHVTLIQPHKNTTNDLPIRMYGVIPFFVEDPNTHITPKMTIPDVLRPDEDYTIKVNEEKGKAMTYTIAIVDEGLLDLTKFKTPDPWKSFYSREALGVKTWDLYDFVCGAYGVQLERILAIGGDEELKNKGGMKASRFKPVVSYLGPFTLKAGASNNHVVHMPNYIGSVRAMIVAGEEGAYGATEKTIPVKQSLMVLGTLPRVLGPQENVKLPVNLFATDNTVKNVTVTVETNKLLSIQGSATQNLSFTKQGEKMAYFNLKTESILGVGEVLIKATSGKTVTTYKVELDIRNPSQQIIDVKEFAVPAGKTINASINPLGMAGTNRATLEVSSIPAINLESRLNYLITYPHGCIEQTTSSVFPQLYLTGILDLNESYKAEIERNVRAAIEKLQSFQTADGGFSYWPGEMVADEWGSSYAGHFLVEASNKGYPVPVTILKKWRKFQSKLANDYSYNDKHQYEYLMQAYRLYTLALAKEPELGAMNRMREQSKVSNLARWQLAAAYIMAGQTEVGRAIAKSCSYEVDKYREFGYTYGSDDRDQAMILEVLNLLNDQAESYNMLKTVASALSSQEWMSTQTTAYCLIAVSKYAEKNSTKATMEFSYDWNKAGNKTIESPKSVTQANLPLKEGATNSLSLHNTGNAVLFARVISRGKPMFDTQPAGANGLQMEVTYKDKQGKNLDVTNIAQGTDFYAEVTVSNNGLRGNYQELILSQIFASGWEILNSRINEGPDNNNKGAQYQDYRDDRVYTYFDLRQNERKTFRINLNATYEGKFYMPLVNCEAMYDNTVFARQPGYWVNVVKK